MRPAIGMRQLIAYAAVLALVEFLLTVSVAAAGACLGLLALVTCLALPVVRDEPSVRLLPVLVAVPVVRLAVVAAPTADFAPVPRLALLALPTLLAVVAAARAVPRPWRPFRPGPGGWLAQAALPLLGVPLGLLVHLLGPAVPGTGRLPAVTVALLLTLSVIPEELLHRGLLVPACAEVAGRAGIPVAAAMYTAAFVGYRSVPVVATVFVVALTLSWCRQRTRCAVGVVGARIVMVLVTCLALPALGV